MLKILITGGAGFIGSSLTDKLLASGKYSIVSVDNLLTGNMMKVPTHPDCRFIKCDVNNFRELSPIMIHFGFDYVFHYAATVGVKRTLENPIMVLRDIDGIRNILDLSKSTDVKRVFFSSSSEVYGEPVSLPQHEETTPLNSRLPYAVVKNVGESFCKSYKKEYNLDYTIFRFFNTYGPKQSEDFVVSKFLKAALNNDPITIYGDGQQNRTFCYIDDNTEGTLNILNENLFINNTINLGSEVNYTIIQLAELIIKVTQSRSTLKFLPPLPEGDMTKRLPDASKFNDVLKRKPISLEEGLRRIVGTIQKV